MYQFPVFIGIFLFGIVMFAFGTYIRTRYQRWQKVSLQTTGTVVRIESDRPGREVAPAKPRRFGKGSSGPRHVWPVFSYVDDQGEQRERRSPNAMRNGTVAVGDERPLFYPSDRPYAARIDDGSEMRVSRIAIGMAALCLPGLVLALLI